MVGKGCKSVVRQMRGCVLGETVVPGPRRLLRLCTAVVWLAGRKGKREGHFSMSVVFV